MNFRPLIAGLILALAPLAVQAAGAEAPAQKGGDDPNRVTCEVSRPPGTRLGGVRHCRTQAEWAQYRQEMRDVAHRIQAEGATNCVPTPERPNIC
jgi:hypothetical protein